MGGHVWIKAGGQHHVALLVQRPLASSNLRRNSKCCPHQTAATHAHAASRHVPLVLHGLQQRGRY